MIDEDGFAWCAGCWEALGPDYVTVHSADGKTRPLYFHPGNCEPSTARVVDD